MAKIKIDASTAGTGTFTISAPNSNTDRTLTLPDTTASLVTTASPDFTGDVTFDTSTLVIDATNNRVGIGTTSPEQNLHIKRASGSDTLGEGHVLLDVADDNGPAWALRIGDTGDDGDFHIDRRTGGSWGNGLSIDRLTGSVGIGTTSPNERLSVVAASDSSHYDNGFSIYRSTGDDKVTINAQGGAAKFIADGGSSYIPYRFFGYDGTTGSEWLTISSGGYVGINESNPTTELDVTGSVVSSSGYRLGDISHWKMRPNNSNLDLAFEYSTSSSLSDSYIKMVLKSSGNVGIGTQTPSQKLEVGGSGAGINLSGGNNRIYFSNYRGLEGSTDGSLLQVGEHYGTTKLYGNVKIDGTGISFDDGSNYLDDYEEGTYTWTLTGNTSGSMTARSGYSTGSYEKIGNQVTVRARWETSGTHNATGYLKFSLPFTCANLTDVSDAGAAATFIFRTSAGNLINPTWVVHGNANYMIMYYNDTSNNIYTLNGEDVDSAIEGYFTITYRTT